MSAVLINLKPFLSGLELNEKARPPEQRRPVPTLTELAAIVGMHRTPFYRIANNRIAKLDLDTLAGIIAELRRRGFEVEISDMLVYRD